MKNLIMLLLTVLVIGVTLNSCGPKCKECQMNEPLAGPLGVSVSMGELCGDDLKKAEKMDGVTCK